MRIHVVTARDRAARAEMVAQALARAGHLAGWACGTTPPDAPLRAANRALAAVKDADVLVALLRGDCDTYAAIGAALAAGKPVLAWNETGGPAQQLPTVLSHPAVFVACGNLDDGTRLQLLVEQVKIVAEEHRAGELGRGAWGHAAAIAARLTET